MQNRQECRCEFKKIQNFEIFQNEFYCEGKNLKLFSSIFLRHGRIRFAN